MSTEAALPTFPVRLTSALRGSSELTPEMEPLTWSMTTSTLGSSDRSINWSCAFESTIEVIDNFPGGDEAVFPEADEFSAAANGSLVFRFFFPVAPVGVKEKLVWFRFRTVSTLIARLVSMQRRAEAPTRASSLMATAGGFKFPSIPDTRRELHFNKSSLITPSTVAN